jgi:hypothetical protein
MVMVKRFFEEVDVPRIVFNKGLFGPQTCSFVLSSPWP